MADVTALLAEAAWLQRLARSLVGNDDADDIVQETLAAALHAPPDPDLPARPWLRRVMVNVVRMRHRGRVRRDTRERASMLAEPVRSPEELLERARVERTLADLVIALDEPLRSTVLLRYREGLSAEAIAAQQDVSVATVRRRLSDAVEYLRAGMDERETSKTWRAAFAPFLVGREPSPPIWSLIMAKAATKVAILALALLLLVVGGGVALHRARESTPHQASANSPPGSATNISAGRLAHVFVQPGVATQHLGGRVTLADRGFVGAQVRITHATTSEVLAEATSGADGAFSIPDLPGTAVVVSAIAKDKTAMPVVVDLRSPAARGARVELRLVDCLHVRGIVSDGSGAPIAHARVAPDLTQMPMADTDAVGHFDLCVHAGPQTIRFSASGYHSVLATLLLGGNDLLDVTLLPEAVVAGTVVDAANRPVGGAAITIDPHGRNTMRDAPVIGRSETDGTFRLVGVAAGRSDLFAEAPGLASRRIGLVLGAGETREGIVLRLEHAPRITGKMIDSRGQPVSGASLGLRLGSLLRENLAVTQEDGAFVIDRAPMGTSSIVVPHFEVIAPREVTVADKDVALALVADPLPVVEGSVTRGGAPAANAIVQCPSSSAAGAPSPVTDGTGSFRRPLEAEGPFSVYASDASGNFGGVQGAWSHGQTLSRLAIEMDQSGTICGTVSDAGGARLRAIRVKAEDNLAMDFGEATSDENGAYCIHSLRNDGTYEVSAWSGGQNIPPLSPLPRVALVKSKAILDITLAAPDQAIEGTIVDDTGAPVPDASVRSTAALYFTNQVDVAVTDVSGHFAIQHLAPGNYRVLASARNGASKTADAVAAGTHDLRIALDRAGSIEGTLVGFRSQPAIMGVMISSGHAPVEFEIEGNHFRASGLAAGTYSVSATTNGHEADNTSVVVKAGSIATATLTSRGTASVSGHVIDWMTKRAVSSARCAPPLPRDGGTLGVFISAPELERAVDASGMFHFDNVSAGEVTLPCDAGSTSGLRFGTIASGANAQLDVFVVTGKTGGGDIGGIDWSSRAMQTVRPNGAKAGLQVGDVVTTIDNQSVELLDGRTVGYAISTHAAGTQLSVTVRRGGLIVPLEITL